jgi:GT2 family glycosyltransferase
MSHLPTLFVAIPGAGYVTTKAHFAQLGMFGCASRFWERQYGIDAKTYTMVTDRMPVCEARNMLAMAAMKHEADWIMWLDDDMEPQPDTIQRLMDHDAPLASANCSKRKLPPEVMTYIWEGRGFHTAISNAWPETFQADAVGMACILMKREVLDAVWLKTNGRPFQYNDGLYGTEDMFFFETAKNLGYKVTVDTTIQVGHLGVHSYKP